LDLCGIANHRACAMIWAGTRWRLKCWATGLVESLRSTFHYHLDQHQSLGRGLPKLPNSEKNVDSAFGGSNVVTPTRFF
jgi:hypothetical protein